MRLIEEAQKMWSIGEELKRRGFNILSENSPTSKVVR